MKKRILSAMLLAAIMTTTMTSDIMASQYGVIDVDMKTTSDVKNKAQGQIDQEILENIEKLQMSEEEQQKIDEEYRELEIPLISFGESEELDCEEESNDEGVLSEVSSIATYASTSTSTKGIIYTAGTATSTSLKFSMSAALKCSYSITTNSATTSYKFGDKIEDSFVVPGMVTTNVKGSNCTDMIPQGMTYANGYIFISAYCHEGEHNSVIYVMDASTKAYVTTLVLEGMPHVGGITYTYTRLWICDGDEDDSSYAVLHYYNMTDIISAIERSKTYTIDKSVYLSNIDHGKVYLPNLTTSSFITSVGGYLYVGVYSTDGNGKLCCYYAAASNGQALTLISTTTIPKIAQGVAFYETSSYKYMLITTSSGFIDNSNVYLYRCASGATSYTYYKKIEMPGMVEQPMVYNGKTYFVFESCSKYWGTLKSTFASSVLFPAAIVGKACGFNNSFIY